MLTFNSEFFCGLLIGVFFGFLFYYKLSKINSSDKKYSQEIENIWKDIKQLFDKKTKLNPNFSFSKMAIEIRELLGGKGCCCFHNKKLLPTKNKY